MALFVVEHTRYWVVALFRTTLRASVVSVPGARPVLLLALLSGNRTNAYCTLSQICAPSARNSSGYVLAGLSNVWNDLSDVSILVC